MVLHAMVPTWLPKKNRTTLEEFAMKEPKFSKQVERRLRPYLSNHDKTVHIDFRPEGANTRTKAAKLHGRRLIQFEGSESIGYVFTADEWLEAVNVDGTPHPPVRPDAHALGMQLLLEANLHRRKPLQRLKEKLSLFSSVIARRNPADREINRLKQQVGTLTRQLNQARGVTADLNAMGLGGGPLPPTNLNAISTVRMGPDAAAIYIEHDEEGEPRLMIDLLEANYASEGKPTSFTEIQEWMKQAMDNRNGMVRWMEAVDNGVDSESPYYQVNWKILHEARFDIWAE